MDLNLSEEEREIREWVRTFVRKEIVPLEPEVLNRERRNERGLTADELKALQDKAKEAGFFGIHTPEEDGGMGLGAVMTALVEVELGRSFVPFTFAGNADNILYFANEDQKQRYLRPTISGERKSCFAITEPGPGPTRAPSAPSPSARATSGSSTGRRRSSPGATKPISPWSSRSRTG